MKAAVWLLAALRLAAQSTCMFEGTVSDGMNGKPLAGVKVFVQASAPASAPAYLRKTNAAGRFCFERLAPATYQVIAQHVGYLDQWFGAAPGSQEGTDLTVTLDSKLPEAKIEMGPRTILTGTVLRADGQPAGFAGVTVWQKTQTADGPDQDSLMMRAADARGVFRFADLPPGTYYLSAEPPTFNQFPVEILTNQGQRVTEEEAPTYFPAATAFTGARPLVLKSAEEFSGVTIQLRRLPLRHLSGRVSGATENTTLRLEPQFDGPLSALVRVKTDGSFERAGLLPGKYSLQLETQPGHAVEQMIDLTDGDLEGINLVPRETFAVPLRIKTEGVGPPVQSGQFRIFLVSKPGDRMFLARTSSNGTEEFENVPPGTYELSIRVPEEHYFLKRVLMNGKAQAGRRLELNSAPEGPLELTFSPNVAAIVGHVSGKAARGITVVLVEMPAAAAVESDQHTLTDQNGEFRLDGIKPGKYRLFAIEGFDGNIWHTPQLAESLPSLEIEVGESETRQVTVPLVPTEEWNAAVDRLK